MGCSIPVQVLRLCWKQLHMSQKNGLADVTPDVLCGCYNSAEPITSNLSSADCELASCISLLYIILGRASGDKQAKF